MAEAKRASSDTASAKPERQRTELEQLLKRVATHIAGAETVTVADAGLPAPAGHEAAVSDAGARAPRHERGGPWEDAGSEPVAPRSGPVAPPAAPILRPARETVAPLADVQIEAAIPPLRSMLDLMSAVPRGRSDKPEANAPEMPLAPETRRGDASERVSEAMRLAEVARRIEVAIEGLAPRQSIDDLGDRFTRLEAEVGRTMDHLSRLDEIEAQVGVLSTKLTDEQLVALFGPLVPTSEDLLQFAEDAATRAADRVLAARAGESDGAGQDGETERTGDQPAASLSELLTAYIEERRRSDSGTHEALETLQLAMQHVLDKIETPSAPDASGLSAGVSHAMPAAIRAQQTDAPEHHYHAPERMPGDPEQRLPAGHGLDFGTGGEIASGMPSAPKLDQDDLDVGPLASGPPYPRRGSAPAEQPRQARYEPYAPPQAADEGGSRALIAAARRAAMQANPESAGPAERARDERQKPQKAARAKARGGLMAGGEPGRMLGGVRPGVLIITSLAAFLLAGYWLLSSPKMGIPGTAAPAAIEQSEGVGAAEQPAMNEAAKPDAQTPPTAEPQRAPQEAAPEATPKPISNEMPFAAPAGSLQEARLEHNSLQPAGLGMAVVVSDQPASIEQLVQVRDRARLAALSQRTGFGVARAQTVQADTQPITTAALSAEPAMASPSTAPASTAAVAVQPLALPPATTGPLSLRMAAAQGNAPAQLEIATRLAEGRGVKQNFAEAAQWYERSASQGEGVAQYRLATLYERGLGVKPDLDRARALYRQSADAGNVKAMHNLAVMSVGAPGGTPDYAAASSLFTKAAAAGLADSQYNLGILYESGLGLPKDLASAYRWYSLAARGGDKEAARRRDMLISRLPADALQAANAQIAAWKPAPLDPRANDARIAGEAWKQLRAAAR